MGWLASCPAVAFVADVEEGGLVGGGPGDEVAEGEAAVAEGDGAFD